MGRPVRMTAGWSREQLHAWLVDRFGDDAASLTRVAAGNSRQIWTAGPATGSPRLLVRVEAGAGLSEAYSLAREARIYRLLNAAGRTVPRLRATSADGQVIVTDVAAGTTDIVGLPPGERRSVLADFLTRLADVHATPLPADDDGSVFGRPVPHDLRACAADELGTWEAIMRSAPRAPSALLELGLRWLRDNVPALDERPGLVHGDAGPGNFLCLDGAVTGIIDWEFAHPGDPVEDLAWVRMRGALDRVPEVLDALCAAPAFTAAQKSGRLGYHLAGVLWKVMVIRHCAWGDPRSNVGANLYFGLAHRRMFIEVMARNLGRSEPEIDAVPATRTERSWLYDYGIEQIKDVALPAIDDDAARRRFAGLVRVLRYLKAMDVDASTGPPADGSSGVGAALRRGEVAVDGVFDAVAADVLREVGTCHEMIGAAGLPRLW